MIKRKKNIVFRSCCQQHSQDRSLFEHIFAILHFSVETAKLVVFQIIAMRSIQLSNAPWFSFN